TRVSFLFGVAAVTAEASKIIVAKAIKDVLLRKFELVSIALPSHHLIWTATTPFAIGINIATHPQLDVHTLNDWCDLRRMRRPLVDDNVLPNRLYSASMLRFKQTLRVYWLGILEAQLVHQQAKRQDDGDSGEPTECRIRGQCESQRPADCASACAHVIERNEPHKVLSAAFSSSQARCQRKRFNCIGGPKPARVAICSSSHALSGKSLARMCAN